MEKESVPRNQSCLKITLFLTFFVLAMMANVIGAITGILMKEFSLSYSQASLLNLSFYVAYGLFSIPVGILSHRKGTRYVFLSGIIMMLIGAGLFGLMAEYNLLLLMSLLIGIGVTIMQVTANPLVMHAGPKKDYPNNLSLIQSLFGLGSFIAPIVVMALVGAGYTWRLFYYGLVALNIILFIRSRKIIFPAVRNDALTISSFISHFRSMSMLSSFIALFFYCGTESGIAVWMVTYLGEVGSIDASIAAWFLSFYWLFLGLGRLLGSKLMKRFTPKSVLSEFTVLAFLSLGIALYSPSQYAVFFFPVIGFFLSVMFPTIYSIAIENEPTGHDIVSGILFTAVIGAAIIPSLVGLVADTWGLKSGMSLFLVCLGVVLVKSMTIKRKHVDLTDAGPDAI